MATERSKVVAGCTEGYIRNREQEPIGDNVTFQRSSRGGKIASGLPRAQVSKIKDNGRPVLRIHVVETLDRANVVATSDRDPVGKPGDGNRAVTPSGDNRHDLSPLHTPGETGDSAKRAFEKAVGGRAPENGGAVALGPPRQVGETLCVEVLLFRGRRTEGGGRRIHACLLEVSVVSRETRIPLDTLTYTIPRQNVPSVTMRFAGEGVVKATGSIRVSV